MPGRKAVDALLNRMVLGSAGDPRVKALWRESPGAGTPLDLHVMLADPDFGPFIREHEAFLRGCGGLVSHEDAAGPVGGVLCRAVFAGGVRLHFSMERASQIAKRTRKAVIPLDDKTGGQLRHAMSFESGRDEG